MHSRAATLKVSGTAGCPERRCSTYWYTRKPCTPLDSRQATCATRVRLQACDVYFWPRRHARPASRARPLARPASGSSWPEVHVEVGSLDCKAMPGLLGLEASSSLLHRAPAPCDHLRKPRLEAASPGLAWTLGP